LLWPSVLSKQGKPWKRLAIGIGREFVLLVRAAAPGHMAHGSGVVGGLSVSQQFLKVNSDCPQSAESCKSSSDSSRREFLGHISAAALAAMVGVALAASDAAAVPIESVSGAQVGPTEHEYPVPAATPCQSIARTK
jgi:hypothetical protein